MLLCESVLHFGMYNGSIGVEKDEDGSEAKVLSSLSIYSDTTTVLSGDKNLVVTIPL